MALLTLCTRSLTNVAFHSLHPALPVASPSAMLSACNNSKVFTSGITDTIDWMVAGSSKSRRVAVDESSK